MLQQNDSIANPCIIQFLTSEECDQLVELLKDECWESALVGDSNSDSDIRRNFSLRTQGASWWSKNLAPVVTEALAEINSKFWNFNVTGPLEANVLRYVEGGHYNTWHSDVGSGLCSNRKISFSIQLTDPESYVGGDLIFDSGKESSDRSNLRNQGTMIIFPSFLSHKVVPVVSGERYCIVGWLKGPPFV